jgi:hypothetical protein
MPRVCAEIRHQRTRQPLSIGSVKMEGQLMTISSSPNISVSMAWRSSGTQGHAVGAEATGGHGSRQC